MPDKHPPQLRHWMCNILAYWYPVDISVFSGVTAQFLVNYISNSFSLLSVPLPALVTDSMLSVVAAVCSYRQGDTYWSMLICCSNMTRLKQTTLFFLLEVFWISPIQRFNPNSFSICLSSNYRIDFVCLRFPFVLIGLSMKIQGLIVSDCCTSCIFE